MHVGVLSVKYECILLEVNQAQNCRDIPDTILVPLQKPRTRQARRKPGDIKYLSVIETG